MATGLLLLLDDIASILDDVATLTKVSMQKTAGVLGDDLALNAHQVSGVAPQRELPIVWSVAIGSLKNKAILVPAALGLSWVAPWAISPLMIVGGSFLCYEGCEKIAHKFLHAKAEDEAHHAQHLEILQATEVDVVAAETKKIQGAIKTDFILSAEIIVIALDVVEKFSFATRLFVLVGIGILMTVGVYGLVALIVKLDDLGLHLTTRRSLTAQSAGRFILKAAPYLMKFLSIAGTVAMFLVGGGILVHKISWLQNAVESAAHRAGELPVIGGVAEYATEMLLNATVGLAAGTLVLLAVMLWKRMAKTR